MVGLKIAQDNPDAIHIATEGPLGLCARTWAKANHRSFTTCYHTHYPQYLAARFPIPEKLTYSLLRQFHNSGATTMVATESLQAELSAKGFERLAIWSRGGRWRFVRAASTRAAFDLIGGPSRTDLSVRSTLGS